MADAGLLRFAPADWTIIACMLLASLVVGLLHAKRSGASASEFFVSGKSMPWWLLGVSMVATTFSSDTPNLVTDIVRTHGVSGNWMWWAFLLTGMLTVFVYARLWRRLGLSTDLEFYEIRYGGRPAAFLRGFRAIYLGVFFNILIMASVSLAAIKIGGIMGFSPAITLLTATVITVVYTSIGGLRSVLFTDFLQFLIAMSGSVAAAIFLVNLPEVGGLSKLLVVPAVAERLSFFPDFSDPSTLLMVFIMPLAVQWWSVWYPGSEPGGGGYVAQRIFSARDESHALKAALTFNFANYALRPWPWILVALASLIIFPSAASLQAAFPDIPADKVGADLAYPAMLTLLPSGLLGLVMASLIAAYMSTLSTHLNWGSSYIVYDFYQRFVQPSASEQRLVWVGRAAIFALAIASSLLALALHHALQAFSIMLQIGAGTGLIFILRWFWWRINAYTEIAGMLISFLAAVYLELIHPLFFAPLNADTKILIGTGVTTLGWLAVTLLTPPEREEVLVGFYNRVRPYRYGWKPILPKAVAASVPLPGALAVELSFMALGAFAVYGLLFTVGYALYGQGYWALITGLPTALALWAMAKNWSKLGV